MDISKSTSNEKFIYILQHSFIQEAIKIGSSERSPELIADELSQQLNLPGRYLVFSAIKCLEANQIEQRVMKSVAPYRETTGFYQLSPQSALNIIKRDIMRIPINVLFEHCH
ncbi:GIY-YIG nuclease family protein [Thalassotalea sp. G2M2-11]|uniref:GIY-YIG nuclease family protein n=1 Tax=Thalassotalea sp. G2M2-11 TaxID=2787627 RepID=UPI0019D0F40D|nr:GIY-YIG nuclease family protein [Thalassotalea sp. G2M2-11]